MLTNLIVSLIVGAIAGWLAGNAIQGRGFGLVGDTVVGLVGGFLGGLLFGLVGLGADNILGSIFVSFIGAAILLALAKSLRTAAA